ncbi:O-antigen ligase family protein [Vibrio echinoideorum]|uniref:O-antigen ligase family protein n=1 Tax=Vibrio echinoideorum TaxID=2100116 RepID=UPI00107FFC06|nr:O-antigen ligase family protein [Vibrio echinoideorum]
MYDKHDISVFLIAIVPFSTFFDFVFKIYGLNIPVSLNVISIIFLSILIVVKKPNEINKNSALILALLSLMYIFQLLNYTVNYGEFNAFKSKFATLSLTLIYGLIISLTPLNEKKILVILGHISSFSSVIFLMVYPKIFYGGTLENEEFVSLYMHAGTLSGVGILSYYLLMKEEIAISKSKLLLLITINIIALVVSGSRGPLIFMLAVILFDIFLMQRNIKSIFYMLLAFFGFSCFLGIMYFISQDQVAILFDRSISRMLDLFNSGNESRENMLNFAFGSNEYISIVIGKGFSSFGIDYNNHDIYGYPHNIFAELYYEGGLVSMFLFMSVLYVYFKSVRQRKSILFLLFIFILLMSMKSFSLSGNRFLILFILINSLSWGRFLRMNKIEK